MVSSVFEKTFDTGKVKINYAQGPGNGPPFLYLHRLIGDWKNVQPLMPSLMPRWHTHAVDLRGHGRSEHVKEPYTLRNIASDVIAFIDEIIAEPAVICGHSLGGMVASMIAADKPESVEALILCDPPCNFQDGFFGFLKATQSVWEGYRNIVRNGGTLRELVHVLEKWERPVLGGSEMLMMGEMFNPATILDLARSLRTFDPEVLTAFIESGEDIGKFRSFVEGYDTGELFPSIKHPTLLLRGNPQLGGVLTEADVEASLRLLEDVTYVYFRELGHDLHLDRAEPVIRTMTTFLESIRY